MGKTKAAVVVRVAGWPQLETYGRAGMMGYQEKKYVLH
jgi:hypothetical protein